MTRRPNTPCTGCGKLRWPTKGSAVILCRECRRERAAATHGTKVAYTYGCRCDLCRAAVAESHRNYRARVLAETGLAVMSRYRKDDKRHLIPRAVRLEVYERDGWICSLCNEAIDPALERNHQMAATLDHIECQSWALIPDHSASNLRMAHRACNSRRRDGRLVAA